MKTDVYRATWSINALGILVIICVVAGCRTIPAARSEGETDREAQEALTAVAGAVAGKPLSQEEIRQLEKQLREDKEAQSAVQAITGSMSASTPVVKYCPITGKRYAPHMEFCPEHNVPLKVVDQ